MGRVQKLVKAAPAHENFLNIQVKINKRKGALFFENKKSSIRYLNAKPA